MALHYNRHTMNTQRILAHFQESAELKLQSAHALSQPIAQAIDLMFAATVHIQTAPGSTRFYEKQIRQTVPIAIFESKTPTKVASIPVDAN